MGRAIRSNKNFIKFESRSVWGEEKWNGEHWNYAEDGKAASTLQLKTHTMFGSYRKCYSINS